MNPTRVDVSDLKVTPVDHGYQYLLNGDPFTGVSFELGPDDHLWYEIEYLDGYRQAEWEYYPSGQLKKEHLHREGTVYGSLREWFENGQIKEEKLVEHGVVVKKTKWEETGSVVYEHEINEQDVDFRRLQFLRTDYIRWLANKDNHVDTLNP